MFEALSLIVFAGIMYLCLIVIPTVVERFTCEEFRKSYFEHLSSTHVNSYGR